MKNNWQWLGYGGFLRNGRGETAAHSHAKRQDWKPFGEVPERRTASGHPVDRSQAAELVRMRFAPRAIRTSAQKAA